jgi:hypothetical protein
MRSRTTRRSCTGFAPTFAHSTALINLSQAADPYGGAIVYLSGRTPGVGSYTPSTDGPGTSPIKTDEWVCPEWKVEHGVDMRLWVNDKVEGTAFVAPFSMNPLPSRMAVGIEINLPSWAAFDVWFDELVVDSKPIGCAS